MRKYSHMLSASEMPGATTARLVAPVAPILRNEFMIPQTVPKRPIKGAELAVVARNGTRRSRKVSWAVALRRSDPSTLSITSSA